MSKVFKDIYFYNYFGSGDIFNTREFVKRMIYFYPDTFFTFAHAKNPRMFEDIPSLAHSKILDCMRNDKHFVIGNDNDLYINTWIGLNGKYVGPGIACTIDRHQWLWNDLMKMVGLEMKFSGLALEYLPRIDYVKLDQRYRDRVENFVNNTWSNRKILICNGDVHSNQAKNFDFEPVIRELCSEFTKIAFIITRKISPQFPNLFYAGDIIQTDDGFDLNEISYLSRWADTIIGRNSGPFNFTQNKQNFNSAGKAFLAFTYAETGGHLVAKVTTKAKRFWSGETEAIKVYDAIEKVIKR